MNTLNWARSPDCTRSDRHS